MPYGADRRIKNQIRRELMSVFETLNNINVNEHTEKLSDGNRELTYLSWSWAWAETMKRFPDATYTIEKFNGLPYVYDELTGYMVYTTVTIEGLTHEMWLPVMDSKNKAMKSKPYKYSTKYGEKSVEAATMTDINKTIMRCLVKNLAMFGLGLYIYSGEDLPEEEAVKNPERPAPQNNRVQEADLRAKVLGYINKVKMAPENVQKLCELYKVKDIKDMNAQQCSHLLNTWKKKGVNIDE